MNLKSFRLSIFFILLFTISCSYSQIESRIIKGYDIKTYNKFFVVIPNDSDGVIPDIIYNEMKRQRFSVEKGPIDNKPEDADTVVYYRDHWYWDITTYMLSLAVDIRDSESNLLVATGVSSHSSLERKKPIEMVREAMAFIY